MRRLKVLFLPHPLEQVNNDWGMDLVTSIDPHHDLRIFDRTKAPEPQFENIEAVVDMGGNLEKELAPIAANAGVKYIHASTNGLDHVEVSAILNSGMTLTHAPGELSSASLAEGAMMFILMLAHRYGDARENFAQGKIFLPMGIEVQGRKLAIVGFGNSGQQLAKRAKAFGMEVMGIDVRTIEQEVIDEIQPDFVGGSDDLDRVISECDFLSVHLHLTDETRHIIDARRIGLMKPTAFVVNVARGGLIDESALYQALLDKRIGGAGLDAFAEEPPEFELPVYQLPNVFVQPHTVSGTDGTSRKRAVFALENLNRYARGEELHAQVT